MMHCYVIVLFSGFFFKVQRTPEETYLTVLRKSIAALKNMVHDKYRINKSSVNDRHITINHVGVE